MKILFITTLFLASVINSYSQADSTIKKSLHTSYKNNLQSNIFGVLGYCSVQYERALNKDFSLSLISNYKNPFFSSKSERFTTYIEARFYTDKNNVLNNGFYLAGDIGFLFQRYYHTDYNQDNKYGWVGFGLGYQLLSKKRFVIDANAIIFYGINGKYKHSNDNLGWRPLSKFSQAGILWSINIGYIF